MRRIRTLSEMTRRLTLLEPFPFDEKQLQPLDDAGRQRVESFTRLAYRLAWTFARHHARDIPIDELKAEALCALTYAASLFKEEYQVPFGAYAMRAMRHRLTQTVVSWRRAKRAGQFPGPPTDGAWEAKTRPELEATGSLETQEMCAQVRRVIPARWYDVMYQYHGEGQTLEAIGQEMGVSRQRVRQLLVEARERVRRHFPDWTCF